jgi:hypothetical protein
VLPAAGEFDGAAAPHAGRPVEVEEAAGAVANSLLDDEVAVEQDGLEAREQVRAPVDVRPAHLRAGDERVVEEVYELAKCLRPGDEVGVEDGDEFTLRGA